jgi:hypothetical protein
MSTTIKLRRDTAANWTGSNPILALGEPGLETDTRKIKYGDGTTSWNQLAYSHGDSQSGGSGTITNVTGTGTIKGLTLSGSGTSGAVTLTLGGALSLSSSDITTALGYTPAGSGYANLSVVTGNASGVGALNYNSTNGVLTFTPAVSYSLTAATTTTLGGVIVPAVGTSGITNTSGTIGLATASTTQLGGVKVDGSTITLNGSSQLVANYTNYTLPTAGVGSGGTLGGVKVDGSTITISGGVITATVAALTYGTRSTVSTTTASLAAAASATATVVVGKGYVLYSIQVSAGAWVTVYSSSSAQSSDSSRTITTDPTPGSGVIAEAITTTATTTYFSPAVYGYNNDGSVTTNAYLKVYNNSGSTGTVTVTLTFLRLE